MGKLEKIVVATAVAGVATSAAITASKLSGMPEDAVMTGKEVGYLMLKCYTPMVLGYIPAVAVALKDVYNKITDPLGYI